MTSTSKAQERQLVEAAKLEAKVHADFFGKPNDRVAIRGRYQVSMSNIHYMLGDNVKQADAHLLDYLTPYIKPQARNYYTLIVRDDKQASWCIHFGDYDLDTVQQERFDLIDADEYKGYNIKIITTTDDQRSIDEAVNVQNIRF